jgi:hypothetical protein
MTESRREPPCSRGETRAGEHDRARVAIWIAANLAQNPVIPFRIGQYDCRSPLRLRQMENGKGITTTAPTVGTTTPHPPRADSNPPRARTR